MVLKLDISTACKSVETIEESIEELIDEFSVVLKNGKPDNEHGGQIQLMVSICLRLVYWRVRILYDTKSRNRRSLKLDGFEQ